MLVDAVDAATLLAMSSDMWDATQILAHAEITRLAMVEALRALDAERTEVDERLGAARRHRRKRAAAHADIQRRAREVLRAVELLDVVHSRGLVRGD